MKTVISKYFIGFTGGHTGVQPVAIVDDEEAATLWAKENPPEREWHYKFTEVPAA